jgi:hypothetical protein
VDGGALPRSGDPEHGRDYVRKLARQARSALDSRIERAVFQLGCIGFIGGMFSLVVLINLGIGALSSLGISAERLTDELWVALASIIVLAAGLVAANLAGRKARINEYCQIQRELKYYMYHFHGVLFDQGLLAIVLSDDPFTEIPKLGRIAGIPGSESIRRRGGSGQLRLEQRLETLFEYYGLICRHYRIEAYPENLASAVHPVKLRGTLYHAFVLALAEGLLGELPEPIETLA